jgi:hypothetical protein
MEGQCSTEQRPQWALVPMEEEEEDLKLFQHISDQRRSIIRELFTVFG